MRNFLDLLVVFLALAQPSLALAQSLPSCASTCLEVAIGSSACSVTNQTCICTTSSLVTNATTCIEESCTILEMLVAKNFTQTNCGVTPRDKSGSYEALVLTFMIVSFVVIGARFVSRGVTGSGFGIDDIFTLILVASGIADIVLTVRYVIPNGIGKDIWTLTPEQITGFIYAFYIMTIIYFAQVALMKMVLLFFYLRIFPGTGIRRLIWATVGVNAFFGIAFVFAAIFSCNPVSYSWHRWDGLHKGTCLDLNALGWTNAAFSIIIDFWMLALPMSQLRGLNLHWKKKSGVAIMFGVGTFVTVVSILRLQSLVEFASSANPTWDNLAVSQWSFIEITVGIMCACMPQIRVLLVYQFPTVFGSSSHPSTHNYQRSKSNGNLQSGISFNQTYTVEVGVDDRWNRNDADIVPLSELNTTSLKPRSRVTEDSL